MSRLPPSLGKSDSKSICLILEGYEELYYFERLKEIRVFSDTYKIKLVNAKSASNVPAKYHEALSSNSHEIVLVVCDRDRTPTQYNNIVKKIDNILGNKKSESIITYIRPCTLQIILLHFGDISLTTQAKKASVESVFVLTGVKDYAAHQDQIKQICKKIFRRNWKEMMERLATISDNPKDIPSTNIKKLFKDLSNDGVEWISVLNEKVF